MRYWLALVAITAFASVVACPDNLPAQGEDRVLSVQVDCRDPVEANPNTLFVGPRGDSSEDADEPVAWQPLIEGKMATVSVAKALFEPKDGKYFLAGVRVTNKTDREIGVDLRSRQNCVRINKWSALETAQREIIDESRLIHAPFTVEDQASLVRAFRAGQLVRVPAKKSVDYYISFDSADRASNRAVVKKQPGKFIILSMDGELRVTNGKESESLHCGEPGKADVSIARPVPWLNVPKGARIVNDN